MGGRPQGSPLRRVTRGCGTAGRCRRPPLRKRYKGGRCGGESPWDAMQRQIRPEGMHSVAECASIYENTGLKYDLTAEKLKESVNRDMGRRLGLVRHFCTPHYLEIFAWLFVAGLSRHSPIPFVARLYAARADFLAGVKFPYISIKGKLRKLRLISHKFTLFFGILPKSCNKKSTNGHIGNTGKLILMCYN